MWEYNKDVIIIEKPLGYEILNTMDDLGGVGWEIFSITERVVREYTIYGEQHKDVEYTLYMKKLKE